MGKPVANPFWLSQRASAHIRAKGHPSHEMGITAGLYHRVLGSGVNELMPKLTFAVRVPFSSAARFPLPA